VTAVLACRPSRRCARRAYRESVGRAVFTATALAVCLAGAPVTAWAQNSPPKPESDCGVTSMCPSDRIVAPSGHAASWVVALFLLVVVVAVLTVAYRVIGARHANG
jgi:hypothetical protein